MFTTNFNDLLSLERGIEEIFNTVVPATVSRASAVVAPAMNVVEGKEQFQILMELPGVVKEDVKIGLEKNLLTISGERKRQALPEGSSMVRRESWNGKFSRSIELPDRIDASGIVAELTNGVLTVGIPKAPEAKPREISIR